MDYTYYPNTQITLPEIKTTATDYSISFIYPDGIERTELPSSAGRYTIKIVAEGNINDL